MPKRRPDQAATLPGLDPAPARGAHTAAVERDLRAARAAGVTVPATIARGLRSAAATLDALPDAGDVWKRNAALTEYGRWADRLRDLTGTADADSDPFAILAADLRAAAARDTAPPRPAD